MNNCEKHIIYPYFIYKQSGLITVFNIENQEEMMVHDEVTEDFKILHCG